MVLNDNRIRSLVDSKQIIIDPFSSDSLSPASYDLSIGECKSINMKYKTCELEKDLSVEIDPGESFLASTVEIIGLPNNITAEMVSKSSTGRKGLSLFSPGWIDPGFVGQLTIGMKNESGKIISLKYGQKLWQLIFEDCDPAEQAYQGHYQKSEGIVGDRSGDETIGF